MSDSTTPPASTPAAPVRPAAPTAPRPASTAVPDFSKVKSAPSPISQSLRDGIAKAFDKAPVTTPPAEAPPVADKAPVTPPPVDKAPVTTPPADTPPPVGDKAPITPPPADRFADILEPEGISESGKKGWKALKTKAEMEISAAEKKYADAEAQLSLLRKATPAETAEVERLKADHQKALDRLAVLDLQSHPDFARQYAEPKAKALGEASEVLSYNGKSAVDVALLSKSQKEFNAAVADMTDGMNSMDATIVQTSMRQAYKISADERVALEKAGELKSGIAARDALQTKQAFEKVYGNLGFEGLISPKECPADATPEQRAQVETYNQALSQTRAMAEKNAFGRLSMEESATVATKAAYLDVMVGHVLPFVEKGFNAVVAERNALLKELQSVRGMKAPGSFAAPAEGDTGEKKDAKYWLRQAYPKS